MIFKGASVARGCLRPESTPVSELLSVLRMNEEKMNEWMNEWINVLMTYMEAVIRRCSNFAKIHRKTRVPDSLLMKAEGQYLYWKEALKQVFLFEFCESFKNMHSAKHLRTTVSEFWCTAIIEMLRITLEHN